MSIYFLTYKNQSSRSAQFPKWGPKPTSDSTSLSSGKESFIPKWSEKSGNFSRVNNRTCKKHYWTAGNNEGDRKPAVKEHSLFWIPGKTGSSDCVSPYSDGIAEDFWRLRRRILKTHQWKKSEYNYAFQLAFAILLSPERICKLQIFSIIFPHWEADLGTEGKQSAWTL